MAAADDRTDDVMSCVYCLEVEPYLLDPRMLPCGHVFCRPCLLKDATTNQIIQCANCREVTDVTFDQLPSARSGGGHNSCDVCTKNGVLLQAATVFCTVCCLKYCATHEKTHDSLHIVSLHEKIDIEEYKKRGKYYKKRNCIQHTKHQYSLGCADCKQVFCALCVPAAIKTGSCYETGAGHNLVSLEDLATDLTKATAGLQEKAQQNYEELSAMLKQITIDVGNFDTETEETIAEIRKARDEQLTAIRDKYTAVEAEYKAMRDDNKKKITHYMDKVASDKVNILHKKMLRFDAALKNSHLVDLVLEHNDLERKVRQLVDEDFPSLVLDNQKKLEAVDENRQIERKLVKTDKILIGGLLISVRGPPTSLQLIREVELSSDCITVAVNGDDVYVGNVKGEVMKINKQGKVKTIANVGNYIVGLCVYKGNLYVLNTHGNASVYQYDLITDKPLKFWLHGDSSEMWGSRMVIIQDQLVLADVTNHRLTLYSLTGQLIRHINCPHISNSWVCVSSAPNDPDVIIVSDYNSSQVFAVKLSTGAVVWSNSGITHPQGVVSYGRDHVLVTNMSTTTQIWMLDVNTGECLGKLVDGKSVTKNAAVFGMDIVNNTLILGRKDDRRVLIYRLS